MRAKVSDGKQFLVRVAGIFIYEDRILLHRAEQDAFWTLPGGACEFFEESPAALIREMHEELGASITVHDLAFVVENFFTWGGSAFHEIGLYYTARFRDDSNMLYEKNGFEGLEENMDGNSQVRLYFQWSRISELPNMDLRPSCLVEKIRALPPMPACRHRGMTLG